MTTTNFKLDQAIGMHVNRVAFLMTEEIARRFATAGFAVSAQDFGILFHIHAYGAMTQVDLAAMMMRDKTTITRRIDGLVKKALVVRILQEHDRRYFRVTLTKHGAAALDVLTPLVASFQQDVLADVSDAEKTTTIKTLQSIAQHLIKKEDKK